MKSAVHSLCVTRTIRADQETLFRAWTDPAELAHWWRMEGDGWSFAGAEIDLRVGGRYRLSMTDPGGKAHVAVGVYREIQRPTSLAFTWDWEEPASRVGDTLVRVQFKDAGKGVTEVVLTHEGFAEAARMSSHEQGWAVLLGLLDQHLSR